MFLGNFIDKKRALLFVGGIVAGQLLNSKPVHDVAVNAVVAGVKTRDAVKEKIENIKEEAQDKMVAEKEKALKATQA